MVEPIKEASSMFSEYRLMQSSVHASVFSVQKYFSG